MRSDLPKTDAEYLLRLNAAHSVGPQIRAAENRVNEQSRHCRVGGVRILPKQRFAFERWAYDLPALEREAAHLQDKPLDNGQHVGQH